MKSNIILVTLVVLWGCYSRTPNVKTGLEGKPMPSIELISVDSVTRFNTADIPEGKPSLLFSFEPWCPYCRAQTKSIVNNIDELTDMTIYFISNSKYADLKKYYDEYDLAKYLNIKVGIDQHYAFEDYFQTSKIPFMAVYDKDKKLKQILIGKNYISTIKEASLK